MEIACKKFRKVWHNLDKISENADYTSQLLFLTVISQVSLGRVLYYWCVLIFLFNFRVVGSFRITVYSS